MKTHPIPLDEIISREARLLATELIRQELDAKDLPLPRDAALKLHIDAFLTARPDLEVTARQRVLAQQDAYSEALRAIGIETKIIQPVDIEL